MKTKHVVVVLLMCLSVMLLGAVTFAQPPGYELEKERGSWCDEIWFTIVYGAEAQMATMLNHYVDVGFPPTLEDIPILAAADWTMASTGTPPIWTCCANQYVDPETGDEPGVLGFVNMKDHGGYNIWSALYSRREELEGSRPLRIADWLMGGDAELLNPLMSDTSYAWQYLSLVYSTLLQKNPYTLKDIPWCVTKQPVIQNWNGTHREVSLGVWVYDPSPIGAPPGVPITGEYMRWTLRDDMTWHDGTPVTSADVEFCLDLLVDQNNAKYAAIHTLIHDVNVVDAYTFDIYYLGRPATASNDISDIALLAPKHIWGPYIAGEDLTLWTDDDNDHRFWDGSDWTSEDWSTQAGGDYTAPSINTPSGTVQLTHLQGNGPFVYPLGGWVPSQSMRLIRWYDPSTGTGWHYTRIHRGDNNLDGSTDMLDVFPTVFASGTQPGMPNWVLLNRGLRADMANPSGMIDGRDREVLFDTWFCSWYPELKLRPPRL